jgi:hypothetical protein
VLSCALFASALQAQCPDPEWTHERLLDLPAQGFVVDDSARIDLSLMLVDCLGSPDPEIRDGVAFTALSTWMRAQALPVAAVESLRERLLGMLQQPDDADGVRASFVALALSEVVRADRIRPQFDVAQRSELVAVAADFVRATNDYRGFDEHVGWRHRVAHAADLVLQLAVNPEVPEDSVRKLLDALANQISPKGIAYTHGEPERFARAVFFAHQRGVADDDWWQGWLARVAAPAPFSNWSTAQQDRNGLARRHDVLAFLYALHFAAVAADNERGKLLQAQVLAAITSVLGG